MKRYTLDTRLTYKRRKEKGKHCDYPLGLITIVLSNDQTAIDHGPYPIYIRPNYPANGWAMLSDHIALPMTKIPLPQTIENRYEKHTFWYAQKKYTLEIRILEITE